MIAFPAGLLAITLLALNFVGDGLRDAWDPRTKE
jgi:peptide/nickel transport system permease protein/oligopeptide transport system permease protein